MTTDDAQKRFREFLSCYELGYFTISEAYIRLCEFAAFIEPKELFNSVPESLRKELALIGFSPLPRREDYFTIEGVTVSPDRMEAYLREKKSKEDNQYLGLSRLHEYFSKLEKNASL